MTIAKFIFPPLKAARGRARFHAKGPVRRFECRLGSRRFHRCHSSDYFRVATGTFALRIRAVGLTGLRGPVATKRFWVGRKCIEHHRYEGAVVIESKRRG